MTLPQSKVEKVEKINPIKLLFSVQRVSDPGREQSSSCHADTAKCVQPAMKSYSAENLHAQSAAKVSQTDLKFT